MDQESPRLEITSTGPLATPQQSKELAPEDLADDVYHFVWISSLICNFDLDHDMESKALHMPWMLSWVS